MESIKNFFGGSENRNPDAQKSMILKLAVITISGLIIIAIIIRGFTALGKDSVKKNTQIVKYDATAKEDYMAKMEGIDNSKVRLSNSMQSAGLSNTPASGEGFSGDELTSQGAPIGPEDNPSVNTSNNEGIYANASGNSPQGSSPRVKKLLKDLIKSEDTEEAAQPKISNPYPYSYAVSGKIEETYLSPYWRRILSPDLKAIREYNNSPMTVFDDEAAAAKTTSVQQQIDKAESRRDVVPSPYRSGRKYPAGTIIKAITLDIINSDFPSVSRARATYPEGLSDAIILLNSAAQNNNRVITTPVKIIVNSATTDLTGVIKSGLPHLTGQVNRHIMRKTLNPLAAAGLIAYGTVFGARQANSINTEDAIRAAMIEQGINIGVGELNKYGGDVPNTVNVPVGTPFEILLTEDMSLK